MKLLNIWFDTRRYYSCVRWTERITEVTFSQVLVSNHLNGAALDVDGIGDWNLDWTRTGLSEPYEVPTINIDFRGRFLFCLFFEIKIIDRCHGTLLIEKKKKVTHL